MIVGKLVSIKFGELVLVKFKFGDLNCVIGMHGIIYIGDFLCRICQIKTLTKVSHYMVVGFSICTSLKAA